MRGQSVNDSKSKLKLVTVKNKKTKGQRAFSINEEMLKTYVPDIPEPVGDRRNKNIRTQKNLRSAKFEQDFSITSEMWIG
jgi:hypothetical protein